MITWMFALFSSACSSMQSAFTKLGSASSSKSGVLPFNTAKTGCAFAIFLMFSFVGFVPHKQTFVYSGIYAFSLVVSTFCGYMALMKGSMAITSLIASYSVVIPVVYGFGFLKEPLFPIKLIGIALLLLSLFLFTKKNSKNTFQKRWIWYIGLTFFGNGICSVIQKQHQSIYPGLYIKEFTLISFGIIFAFFAVVSLIRREKPEISSLKYAIPAGVSMGGMNFLTLALSHHMDASVLFPAVTVFSAILNFAVSSVVFKEKFTFVQITGIVLGILSIMFIKGL